MASESERLEAEIRRLMAAHAAIRDRGFNTWRQRQEIHQLIDMYLDEYNDRVPLPEVPC